VIVERVTGVPVAVQTVCSPADLAEAQRQSREVYVDPSLIQYAVKIVSATRRPEQYGLKDHGRYVSYGASPRATINLVEGARALAYLRNREYALAEDIVDLVPDVLRHRLSLTYEALSDGETVDRLIMKLLRAVPAPDKPLDTHVRMAAQR
jgi:MoxR-like ATPase